MLNLLAMSCQPSPLSTIATVFAAPAICKTCLLLPVTAIVFDSSCPWFIADIFPLEVITLGYARAGQPKLNSPLHKITPRADRSLHLLPTLLLRVRPQIDVTDANKEEYVNLLSNWRLTRGVKEQTKAFTDGFSDIIPISSLQVFDERELEVTSPPAIPCPFPSLPPPLPFSAYWHQCQAGWALLSPNNRSPCTREVVMTPALAQSEQTPKPLAVPMIMVVCKPT